MKKVIVGAAVLVLTFVALRRFGPAVHEWAMAKCQEMMARYQGDEGTELSDSSVTLTDTATPALA